MPLPAIVWGIIEIVAVVTARVALRAAVKAAPKIAVQMAKQAPKVVKQAVKQGGKQTPKVVKKAPVKSAKPPKGNTKPKSHKGKKEKKDDCKKAFAKYPVHEYKDRAQHCAPGLKQSHHVQQNAQFMVGGKPISTICPGYSKESAPCIPLEGKSTDRLAPHGIATNMQKADAAKSRASGTALTYGP